MKKTALIPLLVSILLLAGVTFGYWWWHQELIRVQGESQTLMANIQSANTAREQGVKARTKEAQIVEDESFIQQHVVRPEDIVSFLGYIENAGELPGTIVEVASVGDINTEGRIPVSFTVSGEFGAVMRTLGTIEYGPYVFSVQNVTLDTRGEGVWSLSGTFLVVATRKTP